MASHRDVEIMIACGCSHGPVCQYMDGLLVWNNTSDDGARAMEVPYGTDQLLLRALGSLPSLYEKNESTCSAKNYSRLRY